MKLLIIGAVITEQDGRLFLSDRVGRFVDELAPHCERLVFCGLTARRDDGNFYRDGRSLFDYRVKANNVCIRRAAPTDTKWSILRGAVATAELIPRYVRLISGADFVHIWMPSFSGVLAHIVCRVLRRPYGLYVGSDWEEIAPFVARWRGFSGLLYGLYIRSSRQAERVAVRHAKFTLVHGLRLLEKLGPLHPAVIEATPRVSMTVAGFRERRDTCQSETVTLIYVGSLTPRKGVHHLVDALRILVARGRRVRLRLVGAGDLDYERTLRDEVREFGLEDRVEFVGYVVDVEPLLEHYRQADIFVLASLGEGFPRVIYEAMSQGLPVVASGIRTIRAMLRDREEAILASPGSSAALADAVERLIDDAALRRTLIQNGYAFARARLAADRPGAQLLGLIREHCPGLAIPSVPGATQP